MEGEVDECHLDQVDINEPRVHKKLDKVDNPDDQESHNDVEIDIEGQNPFHIQVILDVLFKMLSFEEVKKFRLVSSTWNEVGLKDLLSTTRRAQKPIKFHALEELEEEDDKLGQLIRLQKSHDLIFPAHNHHQLFSKFSINIRFLWFYDQVTSSLLYNFFEIFSPSYVQLYGSLYHYISMFDVYNEENEKAEEVTVAHILCKFLVNISPTIQEIDLDNLHIRYEYNKVKERVSDYVLEEMTRTRFPNLTKISNPLFRIGLQKMFFYPIIGQNSPKLAHLSFGSSSFFDDDVILTEEMTELKAQFESSGLMSKLKVLTLSNVGTKLLDLFADLGHRGQVKLTKLNFKNDNYKSEVVKDMFIWLIASQCDSLKLLKITTPYQETMVYPPLNTIRVPYPRLQNLTSLQIDSFSTFQSFFEPINFSLQFPKLEEFRTFDFDTFYDEDFGEGGDSVKFVSFLSHQSTRSRYDARAFDKIYEIFPNLEFLQIDLAFLPTAIEDGHEENIPFWLGIKKIRIHCNLLEDLCRFGYYEQSLKYVKKIEIVVDCGNTLALEDSYKNPLAQKMDDEFGHSDDNFRREKLYRKCLKFISEQFNYIIQVTSISFIGYKISEDFKSDFREIFPDCTFVSCPFKPN